MACPKVNPNYPNTATSIEMPFAALVRKADPEFDKIKRFDLAYEFGRDRKFYVDSLLSGAYAPLTWSFDASFDASFETQDSALRKQNGFCGNNDGDLTTESGFLLEIEQGGILGV